MNRWPRIKIAAWCLIVMGLFLLRWVEAVTPNPHYGNVLRELGKRSEENGHLGRAGRYYQRAIAFTPDLPIAYQALGTIYVKQEKYSLAVPYLQMAAYLGPDRDVPYYYLGLANRYNGHYHQAVWAFEQAIARSQHYQPPVYRYDKGLAHLLSGDNVQAMAEVEALDQMQEFALAKELRQSIAAYVDEGVK